MIKMTLNEKISLAISLITLLSFIGGFYWWIYKTNELPTRISDHEERITKLEKQMIEYNTKIDLIYASVLEIRRVLIYNK